MLNNLDGRGKEPFWQQAYADLLKFVILLRKVVDGYTTLAEIYHYAIDDSLIERDLQRGDELFAREPAARHAAFGRTRLRHARRHLRAGNPL